jgi:tetratricopeptide (TPR) repeat protein
LREAIRFYSVARSKRPETAFDLASILEDIGDWEEAAVVLEDLVRLYPSDGIVQAALGRLLKQQGRMAEARSAFHDAKPKLIEAIRLHPEFAAEHNALGVVVQDAGEIDKAISEYREAIRLRPRFAEAHTNLGVVLLGKRQFEDAERECRKAVEVLPTDSSYRCNLATVLHAERRLDDATREVKEAIRLSENYAAAHTNLAVLLADLGRWAEAEKEAVEAIRLNPRVPETHANLGIILRKQGKAKEAIELFRVAVGLNPDDAKWHSNLALCLNDLVKQTQDVKLLPEAESHGRLAVQLGPKIAMAHSHLGVILLSLGQNEEAARSFDEAIRLDSTLTEAWFNLGLANFNLQRFDESVKAFREVTKQDDGNVLSHCFLGRSLHLCGTYADGLIELKRAQTLGGPNTNWSGGLPIAKWIEAAEQFAPFEARISALESGRDNAKDILENLTFAQIYHAKKRYKAAVRHHKAAIASDPIWAKNPALFLKFNAACAAVLGGSGQGKDAATDGDATSQLALRQQALEWLKAELISWSQFAEQVPQEKRPEIASELMKWLNDGDLDTVRDPAKIQLLPVAEREQWQRLWADVKLLTQRLAEKTSK